MMNPFNPSRRLLAIFASFILLQACPLIYAQGFGEVDQAIANGDFGNVKALVVSHRGEIVHESYFRGADANQLQPLYSVTKSVGSALMGIAHRQGKVRLDQDLELFFGEEYAMSTAGFDTKRDITVEQVLQHRHGIAWDELTIDYGQPQNALTQMFSASDWYQFVLSRPMAAQAGTQFAYSSGVSILMSRIIRKATDMSPRQFAQQALFDPLGITQIHWEGYSELGMGNGQMVWSNTDGDEPLGFGLWMKPRDMVTLGELYLNNGMHNGERILDEEWVAATQIRHSNSANSDYFVGDPDSGYGYQFWSTTLADSLGHEWTTYYASGWGHQFIIIFPVLDLVVVSVADNYTYEGPSIGTILTEFVLSEVAPSLDGRYSASWSNPENSGQGFSLQVINNGQTLLAYWYTYDEVGGKRWFIMVGEIDGSEAEVTIYKTDGGVFLQDNPVTETEWGQGRFIVEDKDKLRFEFESAEGSGNVPLTRLSEGSDN